MGISQRGPERDEAIKIITRDWCDGPSSAGDAPNSRLVRELPATTGGVEKRALLNAEGYHGARPGGYALHERFPWRDRDTRCDFGMRRAPVWLMGMDDGRISPAPRNAAEESNVRMRPVLGDALSAPS